LERERQTVSDYAAKGLALFVTYVTSRNC